MGPPPFELIQPPLIYWTNTFLMLFSTLQIFKTLRCIYLTLFSIYQTRINFRSVFGITHHVWYMSIRLISLLMTQRSESYCNNYYTNVSFRQNCKNFFYLCLLLYFSIKHCKIVDNKPLLLQLLSLTFWFYFVLVLVQLISEVNVFVLF